jgi:hypothetical protein
MAESESCQPSRLSGEAEPTGQVAFQLVFALYEALQGLDPVLDKKLKAAIDNTVSIIEATALMDESDSSSVAALNLARSFQASLADKR